VIRIPRVLFCSYKSAGAVPTGPIYGCSLVLSPSAVHKQLGKSLVVVGWSENYRRHQFIFLHIPEANPHFRAEVSIEAALYSGVQMRRRRSPKYLCTDRVLEGDRRGITLEPKNGRLDILNGRPTERWDATTPEGGHGSLWYDPELNFIVKILWTSNSCVQSACESQNAKQDSQSRTLLEVADDFRKFTLTRFANVFAAPRRR
jgi:hypothetical protein